MGVTPEAVEIISRKKLQYCRFADSNQWQFFDNIMLPDITLTFTESDGTIINQAGTDCSFPSREAWIAHYSKLFTTLQTIHVTSSGEFEQISPDEVKVIHPQSGNANSQTFFI